MFTPDERDRVRERVLEVARADERIAAGALTGSTAVGMDRWSDVDVAFAVVDGANAETIVDGWTALPTASSA